MLPNKLQHGDTLASLLQKYNEMVDYLRETRLVAGPGMRINRHPSGTTIESTATASGGTPPIPLEGHPFDLQIINDGTDNSPAWKVKVFDSLYNDGRAGTVFIGTNVIYPMEQILAVPDKISYVYLRIQYVANPQAYDSYVTDFIISDDPFLPHKEDQFYLRSIGIITWQNGTPIASSSQDQVIEIISRWV